MKKCYILLTLTLMASLFAGCNSEKKATYYSDIYSEKPTTIYITPIEDLAERRIEKYPKDAEYNNELNTATAYMYQTMAGPLVRHGYYVLGPIASMQLDSIEHRLPEDLRMANIKVFYQKYGIDAILNTTIHRWVEKNGKWIVYLEYQLRSTKTNIELMHKWVIATKEVPLNFKRDPTIMKEDKAFAKLMDLDNGTAQRCWLVEKVNDYVLRNIPISSTLRQFENDLYKSASQTYIRYTWTEEGKADVQTCSIDEYEQGLYVD